MTNSICKCFTGRLNILVNCLNGFDELVNIKRTNMGYDVRVINEWVENIE